MIKWLSHIVILLILVPLLSSAKIKNDRFNAFFYSLDTGLPVKAMSADTILAKNNKKQQDDKKIKEVTRAKKQPKPEKVETGEQKRPKRQRRPEGLERPPEIPRHSGG